MATNSNRNRRNQNRGFNRNFKKNNNHVRKRGIEDYSFYVGTSKQASDFEISSEFIINYIKRTFERGNDIAESLRTLSLQDTDEWKPKLEDSKKQTKRKEIMKINNLNWNSRRTFKNSSKE